MEFHVNLLNLPIVIREFVRREVVLQLAININPVMVVKIHLLINPQLLLLLPSKPLFL